MLTIYFARHGQTDFSAENRFCGNLDPPINKIGMEMAEALGKAYASISWDAIYVSPSLRARQTADALAKRVGQEPIVADGLKELSYGAWEGKSHEEVKAQDPSAYAYFMENPASHGAPSGETAFQVAARSVPVLDQIIERHKGGNVMIVSHKTTLRVLICSLLGLDVRTYREKIGQKVAAVSCFEHSSKGALLVKLGDVSHLPSHLQNLPGT